MGSEEDEFEDTNDPEKIKADPKDEDSSETVLRRSSRIRKPVGDWWKSYGLIAHGVAAQEVPRSYKQATSENNIQFWKPGIEREHDCLVRNGTWKMVERGSSMNVLPSKYVFKVENGKPKVQLVAVGCRQIEGLDYSETYARVVSLTTIRTILGLSACWDFELEQMDVVSAFLNGDLEEEIYMEIPEGFRNDQNKTEVCKLRKSLYGLKQSPRQWYAKMHDFLTNDLGFKCSQNDPCLYVQKEDGNLVIIGLYVDDLLIAGSNKTTVSEIKNQLKNKFEMKDLGPAATMLGIEINRHRPSRELFMHQQSYANAILERFGMVKSNPVSTPMDKDCLKHCEKSERLSEDIPFRQAIGSIMYLMIGTRPDIAYAIAKLSQKATNPTNADWKSVKRLLRYIQGTSTYGI